MKPRRLRLMCVLRARAGGGAMSTAANPWRALSLHWNPATATRPAPRASLPARHVHQAFHTKVHLHLAQAAQIAARNGGQTIAHAPAPRTALARVATATHVPLQPLNVQRHTTHHARERIRLESFTHIERAPARLVTLAPPTAARRASHAMIRVIPPNRPAPASAPVGAPPRMAPVLPAAALASCSRRAAERAAPPADTLACFRASGATALVWRKAEAPRPAVLAAVAGPADGAFAPPAATSETRMAAVAGATQIQAQVQKFAREAQRAFLLDPTFTERLAEDVLRRVDKRLRIERERRGL